MKKVFLILLILAGASQLRAQQTLVTPLDSALLKSPQLFQNLKPIDSGLMKKYFNTKPVKSPKELAALTQTVNAVPFTSAMPVVKLTSPEKMPIAKLGDPNTHYTMLVKKIKAENPQQAVVVTP